MIKKIIYLSTSNKDAFSMRNYVQVPLYHCLVDMKLSIMHKNFTLKCPMF